MNANENIFFVDDEPQVLSSINRLLRAKAREKWWNIVINPSPKSALEQMHKFKPSIVVADGNMPEMKGSDFLKLVQSHHPDAIRVILTGDASHQMITTSSATAHLLLPKPFELSDILEAIERGISLKEFELSDDIRAAVGRINTLPAIPEQYASLSTYLKSVAEPETREVARYLEDNISILSKIIQIANSAFFSSVNPVLTAHDAVIRLGIDLIKNLVLYFELYAPYDNSAKHASLQFTAETIANECLKLATHLKMSHSEIEQAYLYGLLHNVGELAILGNNVSVDSDLVGAFILRLWGFDDSITDAIRYQSDPEILMNKPLIYRLIYISKAITSSRKANNPIQCLLSNLDPALIEAELLSSYLGEEL